MGFCNPRAPCPHVQPASHPHSTVGIKPPVYVTGPSQPALLEMTATKMLIPGVRAGVQHRAAMSSPALVWLLGNTAAGVPGAAVMKGAGNPPVQR